MAQNNPSSEHHDDPLAVPEVGPLALDNFKKLVRKAVFLTPEEEAYYTAIPDDTWSKIFKVNFRGSYAYADRVILKKFRDIKSTDMQRVEREKGKILNLDKASKMLNSAINDGEPVLFITDIDNDGSFSQSIIQEFLRADPSAGRTTHVEYTQVVNGNAARGFTVDHLNKLVEMRGLNTDLPFLIVTADNGINSRDEQEKIQARFPTAKIIITDHHLPDPGLVVREDARTIIFNPQFQPTDFYKKFSISGAATIGVLLRKTLEKRLDEQGLQRAERHLENITTLSRVANLLDYVHSDPVDKPEKDYVVTRFLKLQGLMNVNNSLCRIILDGIPQSVIDHLKKQIPDIDQAVIETEARNIEAQNYVARILLKIYQENQHNGDLLGDDFGAKLVSEMARTENFENADKEVNRNFIEQLRPIIFGLSVDEEKIAFMEKLCTAMVDCYESIRTSEKNLSTQLRKGEAMTKTRQTNASIGYADPVILSTFNRKFLGKVYNDENPGFLAILDLAGTSRAGGSFRSLYDISKILPPQERSNLEFELGIRILTPGHERAAGFIIESQNPEEDPIDSIKIEKINEFIDKRIAVLRTAEATAGDVQLLTDLSAISLIDRINQVIRGSISNFERIVPLLKITPDSIWTDSYTTEQYTMEKIASDKKFGYVSINTDFHGGTVIVPVELIRRIVANNYQDYLAINYMDGGVFMAERVVPPHTVPNVKDLRGSNAKSAMIHDVFEHDFKTKNMVSLNRSQIKDNPFYKYNDFGKSDFNLFERMVIGVIDSQHVNGRPIDVLAVFDVEANGFGNSKLMNFGAMNYSIVPGVSKTEDIASFQGRLFQNQRGREFLLTPEQSAALLPVQAQDKIKLPLERRRALLMKRFTNAGSSHTYQVYYDYPEAARNDHSTPGLGPIAYVNNHAIIDGKVVYNREIQAEMIAYLVRDNDFKVPQEMTNLTGITQQHLDRHGKFTHVVDREIADYYEGKTVLFGAHNTPYDARILRANTPKTYAMLTKNGVYDSALFCEEDKLAYDDVQVSSFRGIDGISEKIFFYDNPQSDFSLTDFLTEDQDGYYPDRTGKYLLGREKGSFTLIDKVKHDTIKIKFEPPSDGYEGSPADYAQGSLLAAKQWNNMPNTSVKFSVEKLSEQWMTHSLLLSGEPFDILHVDLLKPEYSSLKSFESQLIFFQDNYIFDTSIFNNIEHFCASAFIGVPNAPTKEDLTKFVEDFLTLNHKIQQKFTDSWMYKSVLNILEPKAREDKNSDYVDLVHFQTHIPKTKIIEILREARNFKRKYGIEHLLQHEGHVNGPWEGDHKGDIAFEDKLTLSLLARRMYNPFARDLSPAIERFCSAARQAKLAFDLSHHLADGAAHDSYSYRQGLLYARPEMAPMIRGIQSKESQLADKAAVHVIKLKLAQDLLPAETAVRAIVRTGVALSREDIVRDAKMLGFIIVNEQTRQSLDNVSGDKTRTELEILMQANHKVCLTYKADLANRYRHVEINKREAHLKKLLTICLDIVDGHPPKRLPKMVSFCDMLAPDIDIVQTILDNQIGMRAAGTVNPQSINAAYLVLSDLRSKREPSSLERALADSAGAGFSSSTELRDPRFLSEVNIKRRDPINSLLFKHPQLRMANALLEENINENRKKTALSKPKRQRKMGS